MKLQEQILSLACNELHAGTPDKGAQAAYGRGFAKAKEEAAELVADEVKRLQEEANQLRQIVNRALLDIFGDNWKDDAAKLLQ